jgi:hypothetical protein
MKNKMKTSKKLLAIVLTAIMMLSVCAVLPAMAADPPTVTRIIFKDFNPTTTAYPGDELIVVINCSEAPQDSDSGYIYDSLLDSGNWSTSIISIMPADSVLLNVTDQTYPEEAPPYVFVIWLGDPAIEAGETVRVQYQITVPDDAAGVYYFDGNFSTPVGGEIDIGGSDHVTVTTEELFSFTIDLVMDYNMFSMPLNDLPVITASNLANKIGANCTEVVKWDSATQEYVSYIPGWPINNFAIVGGEGYLVNINNPTSVVFSGAGWNSPFDMSMVTGYNMMGMPVSDTSVTNASSLATKVGANCTEIVKWDSATQEYVSYIPGWPINDFDIAGGEGYLVNVVNPTDVAFEGEPWHD